MQKLQELKAKLKGQTIPTGAYDRHVGTRDVHVGVCTNTQTGEKRIMSPSCTPGKAPWDGATDGQSDPGSPAKGRQMAADLEAAKKREHEAMNRQDPMECVKRALGVEDASR